MKWLLFLVLLLFPISIKAISAESYIVMDADSRRVLDGKNINKEKLIASTTKIMTCLIALENKDINATIKVGNEVLKSFGSAIYLSLGEEISLKDLLYGLMLRSGNDAAIEIAYLVSGDMPSFVKKMNEKAYEIGMSNTVFVNNHGLEEENGGSNTSTAYDMALLMQYALKNEVFKEIIKTQNYKAQTTGKTYVWKNKNKLLFSYDKLLGGKTGYTKKALRTLVTAAQENDKTTIVVTLNDGNDFADHKELHEKIFKNYERVLLLDEETVVEPSNENQYYLKDKFYALLTKEEQSQIKIDFQINDEKKLEAGVANVYLKDDLLGSVKIYRKVKNDEQIKKEGFFKKFLRWLLKW